MRDIENLRRLLEEPPPTPEARETAREALRARYASTEAGTRTRMRQVALTAVAAVTVTLVVLSLQVGQAEAWSPVPVVPPEPSLVASAPGECAESGSPAEPPLLIDQRRDVAVALFGERSSDEPTSAFRSCTLAFRDGTWRQADAADLSYTVTVTAGSVDEQVLGGSVDRVLIDTGIEQIEVSHRDGFYLIWWPEDLSLAGEPMRFLATDGSTLLEVQVGP